MPFERQQYVLAVQSETKWLGFVLFVLFIYSSIFSHGKSL